MKHWHWLETSDTLKKTQTKESGYVLDIPGCDHSTCLCQDTRRILCSENISSFLCFQSRAYSQRAVTVSLENRLVFPIRDFRSVEFGPSTVQSFGEPESGTPATWRNRHGILKCVGKRRRRRMHSVANFSIELMPPLVQSLREITLGKLSMVSQSCRAEVEPSPASWDGTLATFPH